MKLAFVQRFFGRRAATTLVTNTHWQEEVQRWGTRCDIVQDVPVRFPDPVPVTLPKGFNVLVASTFTFDEPTETLFRAASLAPHIHFHVTGDHRRLLPAVRAIKPPNIRPVSYTHLTLPTSDLV